MYAQFLLRLSSRRFVVSYLTFFLYTNHLQLGTIASQILKRSLQSDQEALELSQKACIHAFALFVVGKL